MKDLTSAITYVPNRRTDIFTMMNTYKSDLVAQKPEEKENILKNLANCINGEPYTEPLRVHNQSYTQKDIEILGGLLDKFIENLPNSTNTQDDCEKTWNEIYSFNESKEYGLLDTWRRETIQELMNEACKSQEETQTYGTQIGYEELKTALLDNMMETITYVPNPKRDYDIMLLNYASDFISEKYAAELLKNIDNCIDGRPYPEPKGVVKRHYSKEDVERVGEILDNLMKKTQDSFDIKADCNEVIKKINSMNTEKKSMLLDTWRMRKVIDIMEILQIQEPEQSLGMEIKY